MSDSYSQFENENGGLSKIIQFIYDIRMIEVLIQGYLPLDKLNSKYTCQVSRNDKKNMLTTSYQYSAIVKNPFETPKCFQIKIMSDFIRDKYDVSNVIEVHTDNITDYINGVESKYLTECIKKAKKQLIWRQKQMDNVEIKRIHQDFQHQYSKFIIDAIMNSIENRRDIKVDGSKLGRYCPFVVMTRLDEGWYTARYTACIECPLVGYPHLELVSLCDEVKYYTNYGTGNVVSEVSFELNSDFILKYLQNQNIPHDVV